MKSPSVGRAAARGVEDRGGGEAALLARRPADEGRHLVDRAEAAHRDLGEHEVDVLCGIWSKIAVRTAAGVTALTVTPLPRELLAERLGEADHRRLRRRVGRGVGVALLAGDRGDVDDAPVVRLAACPARPPCCSGRAPSELTSKTSRQPSSGKSTTGAFGPVMPALQTRMSMPPSASRRPPAPPPRPPRASVTSSGTAMPPVSTATRLGRGAVAVPDRDAGALRRHAQRHRPADARPAAGDDSPAPGETSREVHAFLPRLRRTLARRPDGRQTR